MGVVDELARAVEQRAEVALEHRQLDLLVGQRLAVEHRLRGDLRAQLVGADELDRLAAAVRRAHLALDLAVRRLEPRLRDLVAPRLVAGERGRRRVLLAAGGDLERRHGSAVAVEHAEARDLRAAGEGHRRDAQLVLGLERDRVARLERAERGRRLDDLALERDERAQRVGRSPGEREQRGRRGGEREREPAPSHRTS
jgi:hypothetical protein